MPESDDSIGPETEASPLDLLLEIEVPVSVSFGRTLMPLQEVLKLGVGSQIELNRSVGEPVDLVVNDCVIARGEVVVVDGNYGLRIQQIARRSVPLRGAEPAGAPGRFQVSWQAERDPDGEEPA